MSRKLFSSGHRRLWCLYQCVFWMNWIPCPTSSNRRLPNTWLTFTAPSMTSQRYILKIYIIVIITALCSCFLSVFNFATFQHYLLNQIYLQNDRRHNYTTPKSFLELINLYVKILTTKHEELNAKIIRLGNGLEKLRVTNATVSYELVAKNFW